MTGLLFYSVQSWVVLWNFIAALTIVEQTLNVGGAVVDKKTTEKRVDKAVDMTFPASDATAHGTPTGTEEPCRPADRKAPVITKKQIEQAARGDGHARNHPRAK